MVFGYHFVQTQDVGFYHPVRVPHPGMFFVSILDDFGALLPPSPDHSVGLCNDYKLDGFRGIDNGQIWPLQSGWNQRIVKQYSKLGIFQ